MPQPFPDLDAPYPLTQEQIAFYHENGFVRLKQVFSPETLAFYGEAIRRQVYERNTLHLPMAERTTYQKAFIQITNLWREDAVVRAFVFGRRLARLAAALMGETGVRLYHDQALYKEPGGGHTPWHADQFYWPLASAHCCTAWVPLQETPLAMGPLAFSAGSHRFAYGRDLGISDESEEKLDAALAAHGYPQVVAPFDLGEVSFHAGWTFHRAGPNTTDAPREAMTIIYMDAAMRLKTPENDFQETDRTVWCPGAAVGEVIDTPLNPVLYAAPRA